MRYGHDIYSTAVWSQKITQYSAFFSGHLSLKLKLQICCWKNHALPTVSRALAKELFALILKILQIINQETIKNCYAGSFAKIDDYTN